MEMEINGIARIFEAESA